MEIMPKLPVTLEDGKNYLLAWQDFALSSGYTAVGDAGAEIFYKDSPQAYYELEKEGNYTIKVNAVGMEFLYLHLIDNLTGEDVDLLAEPNYTFEARTSDYASRFLLRFILREGDVAETETFAYFFNDKLIIANEGKATLQMVDLLGHILSSEQINGNCEKQINAAPGVYMLRLINGNEMKVQKIVIK